MTRTGRYPSEVRERAVRLVMDHRDQYTSEWAAITSIAAKCGMTAETLRKWIRRAQVDSGVRQGVTSDERERLRELERENKELRRANEILKAASAFFARELDSRLPRWPDSSTTTRTVSRSSRPAVHCSAPPRPTTQHGGDFCRRDGGARRGAARGLA